MVEINDLCVTYPDGRAALKNLSFKFEEGASYALLGANGAGKSTLMKAALGLVRVGSGRILVKGVEVAPKNLSKIRAIAGLVFQNSDDQLFCASVQDDIEFGPRNLSISSGEVEMRTQKYAREFNIEHLLPRSPARLSEGEKKRVAICAVMAMEPEVLFFDEPTAQLDPRGANEIAAVLASLATTRVIATHDLALAQKACQLCVVLKDGEIAAHGTPEQILNDSALLRQCNLM